MKITKETLKRIINEEMAEIGSESSRLLDPNNPLEMSKELEGFRNEIVTKAMEFLRAGDDQKIELEIMNLINSQMAPGTEMSDLVGRMLADMYEKALRGQNTDEFQRS